MGKPSRGAKSGGGRAGGGPRTGGRGREDGNGRRRVSGCGSSSVRSRTRHQARARASEEPHRGPRVSWSRRLGAGLALAILGTSIVLAGQALDAVPAAPGSSPAAGSPAAGNSSSGGPSSEPAFDPALAAPALDTPASSLVAARAMDVSGTLPLGLPRDGRLALRVYVNGVLERERRLPQRDAFIVRAVELQQGENQIVAALSGPAGEGDRSPPLVVTRDDVAPRIRLDEPAPGRIVLDDEVTLRGTTEPRAALTVTNETSSREVSTTADVDGTFEASIGIDAGPNALTVTAVDAAGNRRREELTVTAGQSNAKLDLTLSDEALSLSALPATITLSAHVVNDEGVPVDGADVTFSLSQPGQATVTYRTTSRHGTATWRYVRLPREGAIAGQGFATVMVVLPTGATLQESATFSVR